jgi:Homing endonuclease associated repeat/HNH endonuclease
MKHNFQIRLNRKNIPFDELVGDLSRVAASMNSKTLTKIQYDRDGIFGATTIIRRFGSWNKALKAAGLDVVNRQDISDEELFENLATVWTKIGRQPFGSNMDKSSGNSSFSLGTYEKRFSSWNNALLAFQAYLETSDGNDKSAELYKSEFGAHAQRRRTTRTISWRLRAVVLIRDNCICKLCGNSPAKDANTVMHVDHVYPWSKGGETVKENLQTLCAKCNIGKSDLIFSELP